MSVYSINDLEKLCGIKAHTLRVWEKRYNIITPKRTRTNCRFYSDHDLNRLLNISYLNKNGFKISRIASMSDDDIENEIEKLRVFKASDNDTIEALIFAMIELSDYKFNKILDHHSAISGFEDTMVNIVYPFLEKVSLMSICESVTDLHHTFVRSLIKKKIIVATDQLASGLCPSMPKVLLFLNEEEDQEISLLFFHFLFKKSGAIVTNIGNQVTINDIVSAQKLCGATYIFTLFYKKIFEGSLFSYIASLKNSLPLCKIIISTDLAIDQTINKLSNVTIFSEFSEVKDFITNHTQ